MGPILHSGVYAREPLREQHELGEVGRRGYTPIGAQRGSAGLALHVSRRERAQQCRGGARRAEPAIQDAGCRSMGYEGKENSEFQQSSFFRDFFLFVLGER